MNNKTLFLIIRISIYVLVIFTALAIFAAIKIPEMIRKEDSSSIDAYLIHNDGIGNVMLGKPIPKNLLKTLKDKEIRNIQYIHGITPDKKIFEGFQFNDPQIIVGITNGPFEKWCKDNNKVASIPLETLGKELEKTNPDDFKVKYIVIYSHAAKTKGGFGVGNCNLFGLHDDFRNQEGIGLYDIRPTSKKDRFIASPAKLGGKGYNKHRLLALNYNRKIKPFALESKLVEENFAARRPDMKNVFFYFKDQKSAINGGEVVKIVIRKRERRTD
ncbi:MAG: hypothetical protein HQ564_07065 [Candidatus Saganbacteria bacterium]|nr:hypothetical protein [Candidatus Saganbacteria bacterium]